MNNVATWANTQIEEDAMNDDHLHLWRHMIDLTGPAAIKQKTILDFGCNQGGFLRLLYSRYPFQKAVGADIAHQSLSAARQNTASEPIEYLHTDELPKYQNFFDTAFSHEVLYLLDDLEAHARQIKQSLKKGGCYYAAIGCHTHNPRWPDWKNLIAEYSNIPVQNYSPDDYADAFFKRGFLVSARTFSFDDFVPLKQKNPYFSDVTSSLSYHTNHKILFRFQKT